MIGVGVERRPRPKVTASAAAPFGQGLLVIWSSGLRKQKVSRTDKIRTGTARQANLVAAQPARWHPNVRSDEDPMRLGYQFVMRSCAEMFL
jgi:hypothetical protein